MENMTDGKTEFDRRVIVSLFYGADGLTGDMNGIGQVSLRHIQGGSCRFYPEIFHSSSPSLRPTVIQRKKIIQEIPVSKIPVTRVMLLNFS